MRDIDDIITAVEDHPHISRVHKKILVNRLEPAPSIEELERAKAELRDLDADNEALPGLDDERELGGEG